MIQVMHNWMSRKAGCSIVCLFILLHSTYAQPGFVSIACCTESDFTDNTTSISWKIDKQWYPDNSSCMSITRAAANSSGYKVRSFQIDSGKRCYKLNTSKDQDYLIRGTFPFGNPLGNSESSFDVLIGVTPIGVVDSSQDLEVESIFRATDQCVDFCLKHENGDPYISQLELRPLNDSKYLHGNASKVLKLVNRIDLGSNGNATRYPDDQYDRIWRNLDTSIVTLPQNLQQISSNTTIYNATTTVSLKVLQTAVTNNDRLEFQNNDLEPRDYNYTLILYFLELNESVKPGQRLFSVYINNIKQSKELDILADASNYKEINLSVIANKSLNLTLVKVSESTFGPILNAYEILQVGQWYQGTNQQDLALMWNIREEVLQQNKNNEMLKSWSGDPCLPQPWPGVECQLRDQFSLITTLDISSWQLHGPIPTNVTDLKNLKQLNLSHNMFTGSIPEFPATSMLKAVDLSHNLLTGALPNSLISLQDLTALYFGCNSNLSGVPPSLSSSKLSTDYGECIAQGSDGETQKLVISTIACGSFIVTVAVGIALVRIYKQKLIVPTKLEGKRQAMTKNAVFSIPSTDEAIFKPINIHMYSLEDIKRATQNYKTLIGEGGFGSVHRGTLPDGQEVAVKVRSSTSTQGIREFENELNLLSAIWHENLVPLLGYCCENDQQILVYPYMSNGSLQDRLYGEASKRKTLDWPTRLSIALGAARGLTHLHTFVGGCIIHRDVKSSNIILDQSMNAKVTDFGFSKFAPKEGDSGASLEVRGTAGYLDPEYYSTQHLSAKSDVFSFGVVLLEIISGREPLNIHRPREEWSLVEWAKTHIRESKIEEIVDPNIKGMYHAEAMWRAVEVALACIEPFSVYRPSMVDIVRELEDALIIENNASEYMKSIDSMYSLGGSNRYSIVIDKKPTLPPPAPTPTEPSPNNIQALTPPQPR